jgi:tetratricopeptide (TPR) repeat protein
VQALSGLVDALLATDRLDGAEIHVNRLSRVANESGDTRNIAQASYSAGLLYLRWRNLEEAENAFRQSLALAATLGDDRLQLDCQNCLGEVFRYRGRFREAEDLYQSSARFARERGWDSRSAIAHINMALISLEIGEERRARTAVDSAAMVLLNHPQHWTWIYVALARSLWAARDGDESACRGWWSVARERGLERVRDADQKLPLELLAEATERLGLHDISRRARELSEEAAMSLDPSPG